jgi:hypothetical protein
MLIGLPAFYFTRNTWLLRGLVALVCYVIVAAIVSPQSSSIFLFADVRYLAPLIPLCIGISALIIVLLTGGRWYFAAPLAVAISGFNILNCPFSPNAWCSRPAEFMGELCNPRSTSISVAAKWIEDHLHEEESIVVYPNIFEPPLQYHAPKPLYAWHLPNPPKGQFASLPRIHFFPTVPPPDYIIVFGPNKQAIERAIKNMEAQGEGYRLIELLDIYWNDMTRPEIFLRSFRPIENFDRQTEAVYVYRHMAH